MLASYDAALVNLIQSPLQPVPLIAQAQRTVYINEARLRVAGEGECVRVYTTLPLTTGLRSYPFLSIVKPTGVAGIDTVRTMWVQIQGIPPGQVWIPSKEFERFGLYNLNNAAPPSGQPTLWAQQGQGQLGTLFLDPLPDGPYTCQLDASATPIALIDDSTAELIPFPWTDAVPFYAAWLCFMNLRMQADADKAMERYQDRMNAARSEVTPAILPGQMPQAPDPMMQNRLGTTPTRGG